jgi:hypothetical protein
MKTAVTLLCAVLIVFPIASVSAQQEDEGDSEPRTIEELYLSQDIELQIIRGQALSDDREMKLLALQNIRSMLEEGNVSGDNPSVFIVLEALAMEGTGRQVRSGGAVVNNFPEIRRSAASLLGEIGGERAKDVLLDMILEENEPMVQSEAIYSLGQIGLNDNNEVTNHIVFVLGKENAKQIPDNNLAFASLLAIERLVENGATITDPEVVNVILEVATGKYIRDVRLKAIDVFAAMRRQG